MFTWSRLRQGYNRLIHGLTPNNISMDKNKQTLEAMPSTLSSGAPPYAEPNAQWLGKAAFFISVSGFVLIAFIAFAGRNQIEKTRMAFGERIQKESITLDLVKQESDKSSDILRDLKTRFDLLEVAQKEEASQRANLQEVYNSLLASRTEVSLSEVEQLISIAKRQLYLLGNVNGASIALAQAIELLEGAEKPTLLSLRSALETDLSEIKSLPTDDLLKLAISLDSVINSIDHLPTLSGIQMELDRSLAQASSEPSDMEQPNSVLAKQENTAERLLQKIWLTIQKISYTVWDDIQSLVVVKKIANPEALMLSSRQEVDLRNTLRLSMLSARISLLSRQATLLNSDLERSSSLLSTYFDMHSLQVQRAQAVIAEIKAVQLDLILPELQATTAALRLAVAGQHREHQ